jgi:hypothetical protein
VELIAHPLVLLVVAQLALWASVRWLVFGVSLPGPRLLPIASGAALAVYAGIVSWYTFQPTYFDAAEPTITAIAALVGHGHPLYPAVDAPERYVHIYGPALFLLHAAALALAGSSIVVSKAVGAIAIALALLLSHRAFARLAGARPALGATAVSAVIYLMFGNATFWTRAEPLLICCVAAGLFSSALRRPIAVALLLGVATGIATALKISGALYFVPLFVLIAIRHGLWCAAGAAGIAALVAIAPFFHSDISLTNYVDYIQLSAQNGLIGRKLAQNLEWALFLMAPLVALVPLNQSATRPRSENAVSLSLGVAIVIVAIVAAKPGGGPYHFLPFVPVLMWAAISHPGAAWKSPAVWMTAVAFILTAAVIAVPRQITLIKTVNGRALEPAIADLLQYADTHPAERVAVGYAGTSRWSDARVAMVFRTRDYLLDAPAIQEHRLSGLELPAATFRAVETCRADVWLIPSDGEAFAVPSAYSPLGPAEVFPEEFRKTFRNRHVLTSRTAFFDVWTCRKGSQK